MIEVSFLSLLVLGELLLILTLACGISLFLSLRKRKRDYQAARKLVAAVKQDEERYTKLVSQLLESEYKYEAEELENTVAKLLRTKKYFYQALIDIYLKRDAAAFGQLNIPLEALTGLYEQFKVPAPGVGPEAEESLVSEVDLEYLRDKNQRLSEELSQTMETMGRMLTEYSNIFDEASGQTDDEQGMTDITGDRAQEGLADADEMELAAPEASSTPMSEAAEGLDDIDDDAQEESLEVLEGAVEGLLDDVAKQAENDLELPSEEPEAVDAEAVDEEDDPSEIQVADEQDLSDAFDDLEEIDIEGEIDILSPDEDGEDLTQKTPAGGGG